jgi:hypothetical protein
MIIIWLFILGFLEWKFNFTYGDLLAPIYEHIWFVIIPLALYYLKYLFDWLKDYWNGKDL